MLEVKIFNKTYTFDNIHQAITFLTDIVRKYFGEDHIGKMVIEVTEKEGHPPTLEVKVNEDIEMKDLMV